MSAIGAKRTCCAQHMSAFDPKRTWAAAFRGEAQLHITAPRFGLKCCAKAFIRMDRLYARR